MLLHVHVSGKRFWRCERKPDMCGAIGNTYKEALQTGRLMTKFVAHGEAIRNIRLDA